MHVLPLNIPQHSDNVEEELRRITLALDAVFAPTSRRADNIPTNQEHWYQQRQQSDRYLTSFQAAPVAWMVCDRLLQADQTNSSMAHHQTHMQQQQRRFFAAQTLHTKCRADVYQLPAESLPSLRDSLLNHLNQYTLQGDVALTNRLAMSLSALAVQMGWTTIATDLLGSSREPQQRAVVLQVFKVLPEECASDRLILTDESVRYYMRDHLVSSSSMVFQFLQSWEGNPDKVYEVFRAWIRHVPVQPTVILATPLLDATVQTLMGPQNLELAADVLIEILRMYPSHHMANQGLVQKMIPLLAKLPFDQALKSDDEDVLRAYCRILTEMGESYMSLILSSHQEADASQLVEWVVRCSGIPETEIASITLHFWYRMVVDLETVEPYEFRQDLVDRYTPHLLQLIDVCTGNLMRYPANIDSLADDNIDDLHRDRFYVSETVEDCCRLLGGQLVLQRLGNLLQAECRRVDGHVHTQWQGIESCLTCIIAVNAFVPSDEAQFLPFCFELIPRLPTDIPPLRFTTSKLIGKYASWLAGHPQLLDPLLPFLDQGLSIPLCAPAAAVTIKELCHFSSDRMPMGEPVLQLYSNITAQPGQLDLSDELEVLEGVCKAVSHMLVSRGGDDRSYIQRIVQPIGNRFAAALAAPNVVAKQHILPEVDRLTVVIRCLTIPPTNESPTSHPIVGLLSSSWQLLDGAFDRFPNNIVLAEKICRLHKHAVRMLGADTYAPLLDRLMEHLVRCYEESHQSPFLYAASICVSEYGQDPRYPRKLFDLVQAMAATSFAFLRGKEDMTKHPDVVEELFYLMGRMVSYCPHLLIASSLLPPLFQCAAVGMELDHRDANKGTLNFLEHTVAFGLSVRRENNPEVHQALERVLTQEGQRIVHNLALSLMGDLPAYSVEAGHGSIAGILWNLNALSPALVSQWLTMSIAAAPERSKQDFLGAMDSQLSRGEFNLSIRAFMSACDQHRKVNKASRRM